MRDNFEFLNNKIVTGGTKLNLVDECDEGVTSFFEATHSLT